MKKSVVIKNDDLSTHVSNLNLINSDNFPDVKRYFMEEWKPKDMTEAIRMKFIQHLFKSADKSISSECEAILNELEYSDATIVDSISGLTVIRRKKPDTVIYNHSSEVDDIRAEIMDEEYKMNKKIEKHIANINYLKVKLKEAEQRAGFVVQENGFTYAVKT